MSTRQYTTPLMLTGKSAQRLSRIPLEERHFDEDWLQQLLYAHPSLLPVDEIEPVFAPHIPLCRELSTSAGPIDVAFINPSGFPTFVETKLWRNPEARRQVVAQVIDYASAAARWSYDEFVDAVRKASGGQRPGDPLLEAVRETEEGFDERRFVDAVTRNLSKGRFLLLIVGDGIREGIERMAETLSRSPHLGFALGLVELAFYRPPEKEEPLIVQPRVVARTREVVRAVVEIRRADVASDDVVVTLPSEGEPGTPGGRQPLTVEALLEQMSENVSPLAMQSLRAFLDEVQDQGVDLIGREASVSLHYTLPSSDVPLSFGSLLRDGQVGMQYVVYYAANRMGLDPQVARDYLEQVAALVPGARVLVEERSSGFTSAVKVGKRHVSIDDLMPHRTEWLKAIERMIDRAGTILRDESAD